jgi:hypothetical protein
VGMIGGAEARLLKLTKADSGERGKACPCGGVTMNIKSISGVALIASALAGCITTQEMPLAPNVVRIDTQAGGLLYQ